MVNNCYRFISGTMKTEEENPNVKHYTINYHIDRVTDFINVNELDTNQVKSVGNRLCVDHYLNKNNHTGDICLSHDKPQRDLRIVYEIRYLLLLKQNY